VFRKGRGKERSGLLRDVSTDIEAEFSELNRVTVTVTKPKVGDINSSENDDYPVRSIAVYNLRKVNMEDIFIMDSKATKRRAKVGLRLSHISHFSPAPCSEISQRHLLRYIVLKKC
jgi:hypothetical protein